MSKPPLPDAAVAMLRKPNPAVITTLRRDGQPVSTATWYLWDDGRVLVNMDEGRKRLEHIRADPRVSVDILDENSWYNHVSIIGHVGEIYEDADMSDIDRIARQYTGGPYAERNRGRFSALIDIDAWHGWARSRTTARLDKPGRDSQSLTCRPGRPRATRCSRRRSGGTRPPSRRRTPGGRTRA